ncbi:L-ascorbate peroxidase 3 [Linum perenne]
MAMAEPAAATPVVDAEYLKEIDVARRHLRALIYGKQCAPIMLRLSFHDAGTYDARTRTGGPNGSIRHRNELSRVANSGINVAVDFCGQLADFGNKSRQCIPGSPMQICTRQVKFNTLAGVVAVEVTGGPQIDFVPGRKDSTESADSDGRLPNPNQGSSHLREVFYRMGLSDRDIVVLSGAHTLGRAHQERSGFDGAWTKEPFKFDNSYFVELARGETQGLLQMPTDKALMEDPRFREFVMLYAEDEDAFLEDYAISHKKMSELGFSSAIWRKVRALLWLQHLKALVGFSRRAK